MNEIEIQPPSFSFTGNRLCMDFVNTVENRVTTFDSLMSGYADLVLWSEQAQILTDTEAQRLREKAARHSTEASRVYKRAVDLREAIYRILLAVAEDAVPQEADQSLLNTELAEAMCHASIMLTEHGFVWDWSNKGELLDSMLWVVARSAAETLTSEDVHDVRVCASDDCNWLFLDTSKNHSRRWCDMKSCGNRAKARRHYTQKKQSST